MSAPFRPTSASAYCAIAVAILATAMTFAVLTQITNYESAITEPDHTYASLIESLAELDSFGVGYDPVSSGWTDSLMAGGVFLATDTADDFEPDLVPEVAPPMRKLVARGVEVLPELLEHLDDPRVTKIGVRTQWDYTERYEGRPDEDRVWLAAWLHVGNEYPPRFKDAHAPLAYIDQDLDEHWITVGDLCFVAIGQIVNRNFNVFQYGGENSGSINSPTLRPQLAATVRCDWENLTANGHCMSLVSDALTSRRYSLGNPRALGAIKRLCFYYPATAERVVCQLLSRDLYDEEVAIGFVFDQLLKASKSTEWTQLFAEHRQKFGDIAALGAVQLLSEYLGQIEEGIAEAEISVRRGFQVFHNGEPFPDQSEYAERTRLRSMYAELLARIGGEERLSDVASYEEQALMLESSLNLRSPKVDRHIPRLIKQAEHLHSTGASLLVDACLKRLPNGE